MKKKILPKVCCCDGMPGIHAYSKGGCQTEYGFMKFKPSKKGKEDMTNCPHEEQHDGVCDSCGFVTNEEECLKANQN